VTAVSNAIAGLEGDGHFGPFAVVLDPLFFLAVQTPNQFLVLPQDRIIPFLGGGSLLRSSTLPDNSGVVVALGGAPIELVVATDVSLQFLQVTTAPDFLFRVREKIALRIRESGAIAALAHPGPQIWSVSPRSGPLAGGSAANPYQVTMRGINLTGATAVDFGGNPVPNAPASLNTSPDGLSISMLLPASPLAAPGTGTVPVTVHFGAVNVPAGQFTYV
jgi:Encapsulating protein for peroxidase